LPAPNIAFDVTPLQNAHRHRGIGTYVRGLATRLAAQSDIPIEFWGWSGDTQFEAPPPHKTLWLRRFPMPQYRGAWLFAQLAMRRRAQTSAVKAVHLTDPDGLTPLAGRTLLATVYDLIPLKQGLQRQRVVARAGYQSYLKALKKVDTLFAISEQTAGDLVALLHVPAGRIEVARPGVDLPPSRGKPPAAERPYFLFLGGPNPSKNLDLLLEAMKMSPHLPEELLIAGHWLPKQVDALNARLKAGGLAGRARHVGFVPSGELADLMRSATALVIPSLDEGFGLPVAEGLAAGALVIHSRLTVLDETSGGAALTFDPHSARELVACLLRAGDADLSNRLRRAGLERAKSLTWDAAVKTTLAAYRAALGP
jgi:glycosyltransferase involved in cell wall biosynthesis